MDLRTIGQGAKDASREVGILGTNKKNEVLNACADAIIDGAQFILAENKKDVSNGRSKDMPEHMLDRLLLTESRLEDMATGLREIATLPDPIGEVISMTKRPNGLQIGQKRVPLGVIGIIYEARPNVTTDAFGLCFKTGNVVILKGGSDAINSNIAIVNILKRAIVSCGITENAVQLIEDTSHETATEFMKLNEYIDVLIPRGGAGLIQTVVNSSTVPVIETGVGNCHVFVDESADVDMAVKIIENAKTQRMSVCNACESLLIHEKILDKAFPDIVRMLARHEVEMRCDDISIDAARTILNEMIHDDAKTDEEGSFDESKLIAPASEEDWGTEYLDRIISIKVVSDVDDAINHINKYNTGHSESIVTKSYENAQEFLDRVDAAAVYVNASTRFTDGFEFGFGGEIGISTQKLHARGPMGLLALTSYKYIIYGDGQIRA